MSQKGDPGPPTEKTLRNIAKAKTHSAWCGPVHLEWKFWLGRFRLFPKWNTLETEFFNEGPGPIRWVRFYWLTGGLSMYWPIEERRWHPFTNLGERERRTYPYGTNQIQPRRTSEN